jgi:glycosyltransferase involved in cell wall biosynthesis
MKNLSCRYTFTVFTATFNRGHTLARVYESLGAQTFRDFEWLIVDDGSTDNTRQHVETWQKHSDFPIRYFWQPNQGKHMAFNLAVREARGDLFLNLDSDDACVPEALTRFKYHWDTIAPDQRERFSAVTALCKDQNGNLVGTKFPHDILDSDSLEAFYKYKLKGDKWGFHKTVVLRQFPFPSVTGVNFVPESIVWNAIARKFRTRFTNEVLLICFRNEQGRSDHLSKPKRPWVQAKSYFLVNLSILNDEIAYFRYRPPYFYLSALRFVRYAFHCKIGILGQAQRLKRTGGRILWLTMLSPGALIYFRDRILGR